MTLTILALASLLATGNGQYNGVTGFTKDQPQNIADLNCASIFSERDRTRTCEKLVSKIIQNIRYQNVFEINQKTHDDLYQHYQTMNCQNIGEKYHQHSACGSIYDHNAHWNELKDIDIQNIFCPEKSQRQLNILTCEFIAKYPKKIDLLHNCIEHYQNQALLNPTLIPDHCEKVVELSN